jgi:Rod binding domain-containing protein
MDTLRLETMTLGQSGETQRAAKARKEEDRVAGQFEALFVRSMVASLRQSSSMGGEGGMFGSGPGADTYADWFDDNLASQMSKSGGVGIKEALLRDFERVRKSEAAASAPAAEPAAKGAPAKSFPLQAAAVTGRPMALAPEAPKQLRQDGLRSNTHSHPLEKAHGTR